MHVCFFLILYKVIRILTKILKVMNKIKIIKAVLSVIKYAVTLALGYLGGSNDVINNIIQ